MKEFEHNRENGALLDAEVEAILREIEAEFGEEAPVPMPAPEAEPTAETEPVPEAAEEAAMETRDAEETADEAATVLFDAVEAEEESDEPELTEEQIEASCRQALDELLPESAPDAPVSAAPPERKSHVKAIAAGIAAALILMCGALIGGVIMHISKLDTIYPNVWMFDVELGGLTMEEAADLLEDRGFGEAADTAT